MYGVIEWLNSPLGVELVHALILFLTAAGGYLTYVTHKRINVHSDQLRRHMQYHAESDAWLDQFTQDMIEARRESNAPSGESE